MNETTQTYPINKRQPKCYHRQTMLKMQEKESLSSIIHSSATQPSLPLSLNNASILHCNLEINGNTMMRTSKNVQFFFYVVVYCIVWCGYYINFRCLYIFTFYYFTKEDIIFPHYNVAHINIYWVNSILQEYILNDF